MNDLQPEGHMASYIRQRKFLATLLGGAAAWPLAARAQQPTMPVIAFVSGGSPDTPVAAPFGKSLKEAGYGYLSGLAASNRPNLVEMFRRGLSETGYIDGRNVAIEYRWADGQYDRLPMLASELVTRRVTVITATGGNVSGLATKAAPLRYRSYSSSVTPRSNLVS
jgi:putative tryptophan/tyrosine transport system substrate-binding protein